MITEYCDSNIKYEVFICDIVSDWNLWYAKGGKNTVCVLDSFYWKVKKKKQKKKLKFFLFILVNVPLQSTAVSLNTLFYKAQLPLTAGEYNCNISAGGLWVWGSCTPLCFGSGLTGKGRSETTQIYPQHFLFCCWNEVWCFQLHKSAVIIIIMSCFKWPWNASSTAVPIKKS